VTTPVPSAASNGIPGQLDTTNQSAQINQLLGTGAITAIYNGTALNSSVNNAGSNLTWVAGSTTDYSQPFTMSGTSLGRLKLPVQVVGNGADLLVSIYPDNGSGGPSMSSAALASTRLSAGYLSQVCASSGLENASGLPLAGAYNNSYFLANGAPINTNWNIAGVTVGTAYATSGSYGIFAGGLAASGGSANQVNTVQFLGGGLLGSPVSQPALPGSYENGGLAVTSNAVLYIGGVPPGSTTPTTQVQGASWDPSTGTMGAWAAQAPLPLALYLPGCAAWSETGTVYVVGGVNSSTTTVNTVYYGSLSSSGQLTSWSSGPLLPVSVFAPAVAAINGWLIVAGGAATTTFPPGTTATYYAKINSDGSLGAWQGGPTIPGGFCANICGLGYCVLDSALVLAGATGSGGSTLSYAQILTVGPDGPALAWTVCNFPFQFNAPVAAFPVGAGQWQIFGMVEGGGGSTSEYFQSTLYPTPLPSVPLNATLTNGSAYHVVLQQHQVYSASDYLQFGTMDGNPFPSAVLQSSRHSGTWTALTSGYSVPITLYSNGQVGTTGAPAGVNLVRHAMVGVDPITNVTRSHVAELYNPYSLPFGALESTELPNLPLNKNPTFASGVSPWTATNGTITQSSAQTHGGYAFSGLLTPTGGFSQAYASSEFIPVSLGNGTSTSGPWFLASGWFYTPTTWASFSLNLSWYDQAENYLSTSAVNLSLTGATWTQVSEYYEAPTTAAYATIQPAMNSSPGVSNLLYMSYVYVILAPEYAGCLTSAASIEYPSGSPWPPIGVQQLL
jgi:hypothetical protein